MIFKKIALKTTVVAAAAAMMMSTAAFAADPAVNPVETDPVWAVSRYGVQNIQGDMAQRSLTSAKSSCVTFSGRTTIDGCSSRVKVYYSLNSSGTSIISGNAYFTGQGTKTSTLTQTISKGTNVYGVYTLQYYGNATTATGYLLTP